MSKLLGFGNPLLDIIAKVDDEFLTKYGLDANSAILAEEKHLPLYQELKDKYTLSYLGGGACQNSMRGAARLLPPGSVSYIGCVSDDLDAKRLKEESAKDQLNVEYLVEPSLPTGRCATLITGQNRSLVTDLQAANKYRVDHTQSPAVWSGIVEKADFFYIEGFFLTVSPETILTVAKHAAATNKVFCMNLSAPFLCQFFQEPMDASAPYWDILFGNETEAEAYAKAHDLPFTSEQIPAIAEHIANSVPKVNTARPRVVVITQGSHSTVVAQAGQAAQIHPVPPVPKSEIEDTNGAGDAFVGGFLGAYVQGASLDKAVDAGHKLAGQVIRQVGAYYPPGVEKLI
ncbi:adenosine kinase [Piptocephalis cylindrospora]|uniref:Adenosine kinase n=1 Tax=Piptocephalis cylindrospora TaxID=1907219 RepID=A0A4P9Y1M9_9FUNG|nr:adenosine kinase [Piptocephalis cylindrospora]|eukprot:RKP12756.1 adenosine kinase [Piptocephalis cylindrospora]